MSTKGSASNDKGKSKVIEDDTVDPSPSSDAETATAVKIESKNEVQAGTSTTTKQISSELGESVEGSAKNGDTGPRRSSRNQITGVSQRIARVMRQHHHHHASVTQRCHIDILVENMIMSYLPTCMLAF